MDVVVWYVYMDDTDEWLGEKGATSSAWTDAREFHSASEARKVAEDLGGVVFGWCV